MLGLMTEKVQFRQDGTSAFVKFSAIDDVEFAIKRNDKKSNMRIYRCTERQMKTDCQTGNGHSPLPSFASVRRGRSKSSSKTDDSLHAMNFMKVRGLPWAINESYVIDLFPGK